MSVYRLSFLAAVILLPAITLADVLVLIDGTRLEGRAEEVVGSPDRIAFTSGSGRIELPRARVSQIEEESDAQDFTRLGGQFLKQKVYSSAVQQFQKALEAEPGHEEAAAGLREAQDAISAEQNERVRAMQEKVNEQLEAIPDMIQGEKFAEADNALSQIQASEITEQQRVTAQRYTRDLYIAWAFSRFDRLDYQGAEEKYLRVMEMDPENKEARDALLRMWITDPKKKPEVLRAYQSKLKEEPGNLEYNRVVADLLYEFERYPEAIEPMQKIYANPRLAGLGYDTKLKNAYKQAILEAYETGDLDRAIDLFENKMLAVFPNEDRTNLSIYKYEREKGKLSQDDWDGKALLVKQLMEAGLTQYGTREAELILRYNPENKVADSILRAEAEGELRRIQESMATGDYLVARDMALRFINRQTRYPKLIESAQELYNKADIEAQRQAKENRQRAQILAERGIEYYNEALRNVDMLTSTERRDSGRPISNKQEAIKYARRSIDHFETALRIDPSLGPMSGMDLNARLRDAQQLYNGLTDKADPIPVVTRRRGSSRQ